jgi:hypothetical protein
MLECRLLVLFLLLIQRQEITDNADREGLESIANHQLVRDIRCRRGPLEHVLQPSTLERHPVFISAKSPVNQSHKCICK